jgi:hypothetical protein
MGAALPCLATFEGLKLDAINGVQIGPGATAFTIKIGYGNICPFFSKQYCYGPSDAAVAAGYKSYFIAEAPAALSFGIIVHRGGRHLRFFPGPVLTLRLSQVLFRLLLHTAKFKNGKKFLCRFTENKKAALFRAALL